MQYIYVYVDVYVGLLVSTPSGIDNPLLPPQADRRQADSAHAPPVGQVVDTFAVVEGHRPILLTDRYDTYRMAMILNDKKHLQ
jgi:hypothetical protein